MDDPNNRQYPASREDALLWIAASSILGYLGLFVGTGFSKAATSDSARNFEQLLKDVAVRMELPSDFDNDPEYRRKSLPQIASQLLDSYSMRNPTMSRNAVDDRFRKEIAQACNYIADPVFTGQIRATLKSIKPSWIITTNYDLILETVMEDSESVLPMSPLVPNDCHPPIYHLHGHRHSPGTIKVTEEDYVGLVGSPIDYQRLKLPLLFYESATVMLGYALGDINVRSAIEWSKSFQRKDGALLSIWQGKVFHAVKKNSPKNEPYVGPNGEIVIEISGIVEFLEEIQEERNKFDGWLKDTKQSIEVFLAEPKNAIAVASDAVKRGEFIQIVKKGSRFCPPTKLVDFLSQALDPVWSNARENMGFVYYNVYISMLIDILAVISLGSIHPTILYYLGDALDNVGGYIDEEKHLGSAYAATDTWLSQQNRIADDVKQELNNYAKAYGKNGLAKVLGCIGRKVS